MAKIAFDKYYTPPTVARWCIEKTYEILGKENITEIVEPSAGCGMFSHQIEGCKAYDLYPQHEYIEQADFLELQMEYKKGRLFIGNPPFGGSSQKLLKGFYKKSVQCGDYIAFILPASFYNSYSSFNKFEIVYSCLLKCDYTNIELWTSFTIYKRNPDKDDFKEKIELEDISFQSLGKSNKRKEHKKSKDYDYCMSDYGSGTLLKECKPYEFCSTLLIKCNNPENKDEIIKCLKWLAHYNKETKLLSRNTSLAPVKRLDLIKILQICIPGIK